jgi:hypothetical protein
MRSRVRLTEGGGGWKGWGAQEAPTAAPSPSQCPHRAVPTTEGRRAPPPRLAPSDLAAITAMVAADRAPRPDQMGRRPACAPRERKGSPAVTILVGLSS